VHPVGEIKRKTLPGAPNITPLRAVMPTLAWHAWSFTPWYASTSAINPASLCPFQRRTSKHPSKSGATCGAGREKNSCDRIGFNFFFILGVTLNRQAQTSLERHKRDVIEFFICFRDIGTHAG